MSGIIEEIDSAPKLFDGQIWERDKWNQKRIMILMLGREGDDMMFCRLDAWSGQGASLCTDLDASGKWKYTSEEMMYFLGKWGYKPTEQYGVLSLRDIKE